MRKTLLLILSLSFLSFALIAQKKTNTAKSIPATRTSKTTQLQQKSKTTKVAQSPQTIKGAKVIQSGKFTAVSIISADRQIRLNQRHEATQSIVVLKNESHLLPLNRLDTLKILVLSTVKESAVPQLMNRYLKTDHFTLLPGMNAGKVRYLLDKPETYNLIVLAAGEGTSSTAGIRSFKEMEEMISGVFSPHTRMIFLLFGTPAFLDQWTDNGIASSMVVSDRPDYDRQDLVTQLLFGSVNSTGRLSYDLNKFAKGEGISFAGVNRLSYVIPEELGMDSIRLSQRMDSLVNIGLREKAFPGCQMLLAKRGKVFYQKSYGWHTYDRTRNVRNDDCYDLASVTKVLAPVPALMMLADQKKFLITKKMSDYWPDWKGSNKEGILLSDLLSHQARLRPGVTLYPMTMTERDHYKPEYYTTKPAPGYELCVAHNLYLLNSYPDTIYKIIRNSPLLKTKKYAYSDLGFVLFPKLIENLSGENYVQFLQERLYSRLGASTLMYNPYLTLPDSRLVPTEEDKLFRHELLLGHVHDETAALMGGISGNAGLFGCAGDVAKVMQLYLQNGEYGNERYISTETVKNWTSSHFQKTNNRRGFGFDKPGIQTGPYAGKGKYPSSMVSEQSYGHSGFTGTFVWADPVNDLLFVFLSNRVYPDRKNHKINKLGIRPLLLENLFRIAGEK
ncbi:MAG: serine hydrolase [Prolixibacteraceae bacterium]